MRRGRAGDEGGGFFDRYLPRYLFGSFWQMKETKNPSTFLVLSGGCGGEGVRRRDEGGHWPRCAFGFWFKEAKNPSS